MGLWDTLTGRSKPPQPQLDQLFGLPTAAITLQAGMDMVPTGRGAICFQGAAGPAMDEAVQGVVELLNNDDDRPVEVSRDEYGYSWLVSYQDTIEGLATDLNAVATSLELHGFADRMLCALVSFRDPAGRALALVYLAKSGTFYPFAPSGEKARDNVLEIQVRDLLKGELSMEPDLQRWLALWGAPASEAGVQTSLHRGRWLPPTDVRSSSSTFSGHPGKKRTMHFLTRALHIAMAPIRRIRELVSDGDLQDAQEHRGDYHEHKANPGTGFVGGAGG